MKALSSMILCILLVVTSWITYGGEEKGAASGVPGNLHAHYLLLTSAVPVNHVTIGLPPGKGARTSVMLSGTAEYKESFIGHAVSRPHRTDEDSALAPLLVLVTPAHLSWLSHPTFLPTKYVHQFIPAQVQADVALQRYTFVFSIFQRIFSQYIRINAP